MKTCLLIVLGFTVSLVAQAEVVTAESAAFDFNASDSTLLTSPVEIGYSPSWIGDAALPGASVEIVALTHPGLFNATTTAVYSAAADEVGTCSYAPEEGVSSFRLVMKVVKDDLVLGTLERDISIGSTYVGQQLDADVDTRAASLQLVVETRPDALSLAYDRNWFPGAASLRLEVMNRTTGRAEPVVDSTNTIAVLTSPKGDCQWTGYWLDGTTALRLTPLDENGAAVGDPIVSPPYFIKLPLGFMMIVR